MAGIKRSARLLVAAAIVALPTAAQAGGVLRATSAAAALGLVLPAKQQTFKVGESFDCKVVAPAKLGAHGLAGLRANESVRVTVTGPNEFKVTAGRTSRSFTLDEQGAVKRK